MITTQNIRTLNITNLLANLWAYLIYNHFVSPRVNALKINTVLLIKKKSMKVI